MRCRILTCFWLSCFVMLCWCPVLGRLSNLILYCSVLSSSLYWLLIQQRLQYKINTLSYNCITGTAPSYLCDCLQLYTPSCTLRSASDTLSLQIPRTRLSTVGSRAFSLCGPSTWNDLPLPLRQKPSLDSLKCNLNTFFSPKLSTCHVSVPCCCLHPSQICVCCRFSAV